MAAVNQASHPRRAGVLIVDDDENTGRLVRAALPESKFHTTWCRDVAGAMQSIEKETPDVVLIDISIDSSASGFDLLRFMRERPETANVPAVMLTASGDTLDRAKSLRLGADRYLVKPVRSETLRRVVNEVLATRDGMWSTFTLTSQQAGRLRELFFDETTELPTLAVVVDQLKKRVDDGESLEVYCIEIEPLFRLDERDYWSAFDELRREFVRGVRVMVSPILGNDVIVATSHSGASDFYCFVSARSGTSATQTARELERVARAAFRSVKVDPVLTDEVMIFAGSSVTQPQPLFAPRILYNAVREAKDSAERRETRYFHALRERVTRAIAQKQIRTVFQPIVDLRSRTIVGYEALSRGPAGTDIENPEVIFEVARDFDLVWELERLCIENVSPTLRDVCDRGLLFFNVESSFIQQLQQRGMDVFNPFFNCQTNVVIEVTERSAIRDYNTFRRSLSDLKSLGFRIAIDDCGSGYATLEAVAELQPDYLKVGHSLFRGVERDPIRTRLVDLVARCADTIGATTIAEAIETEAQLKICEELGIQQGQGYLFAAPASWEEIRKWRAG
jgi:EAL domain-containing protein (putative c-di-GMP-specific phosphodiesterase class I)/DNA-binding response OmpR family regulator